MKNLNRKSQNNFQLNLRQINEKLFFPPLKGQSQSFPLNNLAFF